MAGGDSDDDRDDEGDGPKLRPAARRFRVIEPLGMRVLVKLVHDEDKSPGGLYLPQGVAEKHQEALYGEVVEVARAHSSGEESLGENVSGVPAGSHVLFPKSAGVGVPWDAELRLIETKEILATVEELDYDEVH